MQLRFREKNRDIFEAIKQGRKKVETRAATQKYRKISSGDTIFFICGKDSSKKEVKSVEIFNDIDELLLNHKIKEIAPDINTKEELEKMYNSFPGYKEKIKKFGLIALEFK
jgi:ASC-1-like (ASCH) protein